MKCSCEDPATCCAIEAVVSVDERGQMVMPKDVREKIGVKPGDKFALVSWQKDNKACCLFLIKTDEFADMVKEKLTPIMQSITK